MTSPHKQPASTQNNAPPAPDAPMVEWALWNASQGFRVFPVRAGTKDKPTIPQLSLATCDEAQIREWWSRPGHEDDNPAAGSLPDHVVIDLDTRDKKTGAENDWRPSAKLLKISNEAAASAMRVQTRNGAHYYWRRPAAANILSANAVEPFIDVRGLEGQGYLLLPGAKVAYTDKDGVNRLYRYRITHRPDEVGELPATIAEAILTRQKTKRQRCKVGAIAPGAEIDSDLALEMAREAAAAWPPSVEGERGRDNMLALVMRLGDLGVSAGACLDVLMDEGGWNDRCAPPWPPEYLEYQVQTMFQSRTSPIGCRQPSAQFAGVCIDPPQPIAPTAVRSMSLRWADSGSAYDPNEESWLLDGMLPAHGVGIIGGPSQSGKTFLVYALAQCLATGEPFFGEKPEELISTFVLQSESFRSGCKRLHAIDVRRGNSDPLPISILDAGGIGTAEERRAIVDAVSAKRDEFARNGFPRLGVVTIDTLSASRLLADEKDNDGIAEAIRFLYQLAEAFQCLVLVTHHPTKSAGEGLRGGGALTANVDVVVEVKRDGKATVREVECVKQRDGEQRPWGHFTLPAIEIGKRANGKPVTSCYVSMNDGAAPPAAKPLDEHERAALDLLREIYADDQRSSASTFMDTWKRLCADDEGVSTAEKPESRQRAAGRAVKGLIDKGRVLVSGSGRNQIVRPVDLVILPPVFEGVSGQG